MIGSGQQNRRVLANLGQRPVRATAWGIEVRHPGYTPAFNPFSQRLAVWEHLRRRPAYHYFADRTTRFQCVEHTDDHRDTADGSKRLAGHPSDLCNRITGAPVSSKHHGRKLLFLVHREIIAIDHRLETFSIDSIALVLPATYTF